MNEEELIQETRRLIERWDNVRVVGLGWSGDPRRGFQFNPTDVRTGGGGSGGTPPPPTTSGACCPTSGDCFIATQSICEAGGGTYQGDDTTCDPDPCATTGACCATDGSCSITAEIDCIGTYQGNGTVCDPNTCPQPCSCYFVGFLGIGHYSVKTEHTVLTEHNDPTMSAAGCDKANDLTKTTTIRTNEFGCYEEVTCSGTSVFSDTNGHSSNCDYVSDGFGDCTLLHISGDQPCNPVCNGACPSCSLSTISDTEQSCTCSYSAVGQSADLEQTVTLSGLVTCL